MQCEYDDKKEYYQPVLDGLISSSQEGLWAERSLPNPNPNARTDRL